MFTLMHLFKHRNVHAAFLAFLAVVIAMTTCTRPLSARNLEEKDRKPTLGTLLAPPRPEEMPNETKASPPSISIHPRCTTDTACLEALKIFNDTTARLGRELGEKDVLAPALQNLRMQVASPEVWREETGGFLRFGAPALIVSANDAKREQCISLILYRAFDVLLPLNIDDETIAVVRFALPSLQVLERLELQAAEDADADWRVELRLAQIDCGLSVLSTLGRAIREKQTDESFPKEVQECFSRVSIAINRALARRVVRARDVADGLEEVVKEMRALGLMVVSAEDVASERFDEAFSPFHELVAYMRRLQARIDAKPGENEVRESPKREPVVAE